MSRELTRRRVIALVASGAALGGSAGCLAEPDGPASPTDGTPTPTATTAPPTPEAITDRSFSVTSRQCGTEEGEAASVAFADGVTVTGVIVGQDGCRTAQLGDVRFDGDRLDVTVETVRESTTGACTQCLTEIAYEASFAFSGDGASHVVVTHRGMGFGKVVADVER